MDKVKSCYHLIWLTETDVRYKWLLIYCYRRAQLMSESLDKISFTRAKDWMDDWVKTSVGGPGLDYRTCHIMVDYLNNHRNMTTEYIQAHNFKEPLP